jgi:sec-independent protein translocase protein TatC
MSFWDHLEELRKRSLHTLILILILTCFVFYLYDELFVYIRDMILPTGITLIVITPFEALFARIKFSIALATIIALPFILYELYKFLSPIFSKKQGKKIYLFLLFFLVLFFLGLMFGLFVLIPLTFKFLLLFAYPIAQPLLSLDSVIDVVILLVLGSAVCFQIPIVMMIMTALDIASPEMFAEKRSYFILIIAIITAAITPDPTGITMLLFLAPLLLLYEFGILITRKLKI